MNLINFIDPISDLAILAGEAILEVYNSDFEIEEKSDLSPLTEADLRSHKVIIRGLKSNDPKAADAAHKQIVAAKEAEAEAHCA